MTLGFQVGQLYHRRDDIHARYGGQQQGDIATPTAVPAVFLFTGDGGEAHGYSDGWAPDGSFRYFGEGQLGDVQLKVGFSLLSKNEGIILALARELHWQMERLDSTNPSEWDEPTEHQKVFYLVCDRRLLLQEGLLRAWLV